MQMCGDYLNELLFDADKSNHRAVSVLTQQQFLQTTALENLPSTIKALETLRLSLLDPANVRLQVVGDIYSLPEPFSPWQQHFNGDTAAPKLLLPVQYSQAVQTTVGRQPSGTISLIPMPSIECTFSVILFRHLNSYEISHSLVCFACNYWPSII
jgi:hypothetical protein